MFILRNPTTTNKAHDFLQSWQMVLYLQKSVSTVERAWEGSEISELCFEQEVGDGDPVELVEVENVRIP